MPRRRRERPITALREVPSTLAISAAVLPAACMVSSFLSRAAVQLVCMFFFVAIVAPPSAGAAPCGAHRSAAAGRPRARPAPRAGAANAPGTGAIVHIFLTGVTRIVRGRAGFARAAPGSRLGARARTRCPIRIPWRALGRDTRGVAKQSLVSRASEASALARAERDTDLGFTRDR